MCFFIVMEIGNSNNPPFTPLDPESGIRDPDPGSGSVFFRGLDPDPEKNYRIRNTVLGNIDHWTSSFLQF